MPRRGSPWLRGNADRALLTRPVAVWLWVTALLKAHGEDALALRIRAAMDGRRLGDNATLTLTADEQQRVEAALQDWLGEHLPD